MLLNKKNNSFKKKQIFMKKATIIVVLCIIATNNSFAQPVAHGLVNPVAWGVLYLIGGIMLWGTWYVMPLIIESFVGVRKS